MNDSTRIVLASIVLAGFLAALASAYWTVRVRAEHRVRGKWADTCGDCLRIKDVEISCERICQREVGGE